MNKIPPFFANNPDDSHCVTAVYRMLYKYFFNKDYTWEEIEAIAKAVPGKGTWTHVVDTHLAKCGVSITNIELTDYKALYKEGPEYLKKIYGEKTAKYYLERSNISSVLEDIPQFLEWVNVKSRRSSVEEIIKYLKEGSLIGAELNASILNNKPGFSLHFVLIYDYDGKYFYIHDPGLPPYPAREITTEKLRESFQYPGGSWGIHAYKKN